MDNVAGDLASGVSSAAVLREFALALMRGARHGDLSRAASGTLSTLDRHGPQRITELAAQEAVSQPAMTGLIQRLEASGHVVRTDDPLDARASLIAITGDGMRLLAERRAAHEEHIASAVARLSDNDRARLAAAIPAITAVTEHYARR